PPMTLWAGPAIRAYVAAAFTLGHRHAHEDLDRRRRGLPSIIAVACVSCLNLTRMDRVRRWPDRLKSLQISLRPALRAHGRRSCLSTLGSSICPASSSPSCRAPVPPSLPSAACASPSASALSPPRQAFTHLLTASIRMPFASP